MFRHTRLNNNWFVRYCDYGRGERFGFHTEQSTKQWLPATVPGDVHLDLMAAGMIKDPFYGLESDHCLWMEEKDWWYRTVLSIPDLERTREQKHILLKFHGLDTFATVYLNGRIIGSHRNMFTPLTIDVTHSLVAGDNDLRVCLASPAFAPDIHPESLLARTPPQRLCSRKAQACYGWDIAPRLVTIGIWRPVEILFQEQAVIADSWVRTIQIAESTEVELEITIANNEEKPQELLVDLAIFDQKRSLPIYLDDSAKRYTENFNLKNPPLWWPYNHGSPALLPYSVTLSSNGRILDRYDGEFGIRTIELVEPSRGDGRTGFHIKVNNKPIFLKGMNWTPCDAIYARITDDRYQALLTRSVESNINTLRVWGGGIYEVGSFYKLCDRMGIMVWQDFMFSCGVYPQEDAFFAEVTSEAEYIVRSLRNHPSVFLWCGDNEVDWVYLQENVPNFWENGINRHVLPEVCRALDPSRPYVPSTPFSNGLLYPNDASTGDVHLWKHGSSYRDTYYAECYPNMVTEIGHISLPSLEVLKAFIPEDKLWPPFNEYWYLHCSDPNRSGDSYRVQSYFDSIAANGRPTPKNLETLIRLMQHLQTEATEFWIRHFSTQPDCWGIFLWNLCDCWPQISDAYIAYPCEEKPALAAVREGFAGISR